MSDEILDMLDDYNLGNASKPRSYRCPECGGEFNNWEEEENTIGQTISQTCPFCGREKGSYGEDKHPTIQDIEDSFSADTLQLTEGDSNISIQIEELEKLVEDYLEKRGETG